MVPTRNCTPMAAAALLAALAACEPPTGNNGRLITADAVEARLGPDVVFLAMRVSPDVHMEALFEGDVMLDEAGCLRFDLPDASTVVWPRGWAFEEVDGRIRILDADGRLVGRIGEAFKIGGGEVDALPQAMGFTEDDRTLAESYCPGKYWIATP